ncbi:splicing factor, proline- and glutamine-rich-like [Dorcoceras hygrometricum]|uniref:Splicing factor, proline-and glutamine-rich-like n=1 Tax=Dorcoceras hygrometricum TaxID=472368 RepID=A0A2Z7D938_9LAMI|nr:splicing factor, proline- and glutamine-rich-like [Dorcoceras hygrometricum]
MASSLYVNTVHVCFESVLAMDNAGMVVMFESLVATGLKGFLGFPIVIHEAALLDFFENGSVRDGLVVSTVNGVTVEISEQLLAETFELPVEGLKDLSEIPKDIVFDARSIVSLSGEPAGSFDAITQEKFLMMAAITCGVKINWNRLLFNILKDMVTPGSRQAKGYAIQISLLLENVPNLELGESSEFPSSKILTEKTVHRYISLNDKVGMEDVTDEPRVKKTPVKKAASKKRPAVTTAAEPVVKKKRKTKSKSGSSKDKLEILSVAQDAVPLQIIEPTPAAPVEKPPVPKRKIQKRKRRLVLGSDDDIIEQPAAEVASETTVGEPAVKVAGETVVEESAVANVLEEQQRETVVENIAEPDSEPAVADFANAGMSIADDVDIIIGQVLAETAQIGPDEEEQDVGGLDVAGTAVSESGVGEQAAPKADELEQWFNLSYEEFHARIDADRPIETAIECPLPSANVEITKITLGKSISIPGVDEGDWYKAGLPKIPEADKGKAPLMERDPIKGNPVKEKFSLILEDIEILVQLREQIIDDVDRFFNSFSLKKDSRKTNNALSEVMCKIYHVERVFLDSLVEQSETFRGLFKRSRQESQNDNNALSLALKAVHTQNVILSKYLEATRKEVKDIKAALSKDFDDKLADIRNELLEFRVDTQGQLASLSTHLAELIAFLTKGSDDKKGEDSSSRRPQPPPDNQSRPSGGSGGSGNRVDEQSRPVGSGSRGESQRRGDSSGS